MTGRTERTAATSSVAQAEASDLLVTYARAITTQSAGNGISQRVNATIKAAPQPFLTDQTGIATVAAMPTAPAFSSILAADADIKGSFGASPLVFGTGEIGGGHGTGGGTETTVSELDLTVDLTKASSRDDLVLGLFHGVATGSGVTGVTFDLTADGTDVVHKVFASAAAATIYFTDNGIDLASLTGGTIGADQLKLAAALTVTSTGAGAGFYGDIVVGSGDGTLSSAATAALTGSYKNLVLTGAADSNATGNALDNRIVGNSGDNHIHGGAGADTLTGGAGADVFTYSAPSDSTVAAPDLITDFQHGTDKIDLSKLHTGAADTVHIVTNGGYTYVEVDQGGNGSIDLMIKLAGAHAATSGDIIWGAAPAATHGVEAPETMAHHDPLIAALHVAAADHAAYL